MCGTEMKATMLWYEWVKSADAPCGVCSSAEMFLHSCKRANPEVSNVN